MGYDLEQSSIGSEERCVLSALNGRLVSYSSATRSTVRDEEKRSRDGHGHLGVGEDARQALGRVLGAELRDPGSGGH